ncbi:hypothetical protein PanWU01x14_325480 [Parasponia andersonii]|uniref:Uncharacterized protein n=1 Tax=Parasponia andersonii TaxID=3476 RepID=A0A2P5AJU0_PARAD|nr:hypothetical protein PanWU01x14_325480 [Parasponia andersonii]
MIRLLIKHIYIYIDVYVYIHKPCVGFQMHNESRDLGEQEGEGSLERRGRRGEVLLPGEKADDVDHADLPYASALVVIGGVVTAPDAERGLAEPLQGGQGLGDGGGGGKRPKRGLP